MDAVEEALNKSLYQYNNDSGANKLLEKGPQNRILAPSVARGILCLTVFIPCFVYEVDENGMEKSEMDFLLPFIDEAENMNMVLNGRTRTEYVSMAKPSAYMPSFPGEVMPEKGKRKKFLGIF